jgi:CopG family nickel-responsive transcriptional regulator
VKAVRDVAGLGLERARIGHSLSSDCVARLSCVFNHSTRELAKRLTDARHEHHGYQLAIMHVHLDHDNCLEVACFAAKPPKCASSPKTIIAERGVAYGQVNFVPVSIDTATHVHDGA